MDAGADFWKAISHELSRSNVIILACTPTYKLKAEGTVEGGLKVEFDQIVEEADKRLDLKVIPVVRDTPWSTSVPSVFASRFGIDMGDTLLDNEQYQKLLSLII